MTRKKLTMSLLWKIGHTCGINEADIETFFCHNFFLKHHNFTLFLMAGASSSAFLMCVLYHFSWATQGFLWTSRTGVILTAHLWCMRWRRTTGRSWRCSCRTPGVTSTQSTVMRGGEKTWKGTCIGDHIANENLTLKEIETLKWRMKQLEEKNSLINIELKKANFEYLRHKTFIHHIRDLIKLFDG